MRPIRLELSAFGPYLEHTVIDFEKLNEAGLFLITGQTGGGKTTLLDAMSIALFYKSTGGRRTFQDMRCLAAADSDRTEVVYHFALGEDEYCFRRARHWAHGRHALPRLRRGAPPRARRAVRR